MQTATLGAFEAEVKTDWARLRVMSDADVAAGRV